MSKGVREDAASVRKAFQIGSFASSSRDAAVTYTFPPTSSVAVQVVKVGASRVMEAGKPANERKRAPPLKAEHEVKVVEAVMVR